MRKAKPAESFFNFFSPPVPPSEETIESGEIDEDELEAIEEQLEIDYQIGEDLKEKVSCGAFERSSFAYHLQIIPRAVDYFTGKALEYEGFDEDDDFEDLDDEDDDEDRFEDVRTSSSLRPCDLG